MLMLMAELLLSVACSNSQALCCGCVPREWEMELRVAPTTAHDEISVQVCA